MQANLSWEDVRYNKTQSAISFYKARIQDETAVVYKYSLNVC
jgi:hypothetical protein